MSRTTLSRASQAGAVPADIITGLRPHDCGCTWAAVRGVMTLKFIHAGCPVHSKLPRAAEGLRSWMLRK